MKLKRLLEADDKELRQVQEIVRALPDIFKEAITTSDYFKKRLPQLAKQMTAEQAIQVLDLYINKDYDIIKVAEKELLTSYFQDPQTLNVETKTNLPSLLIDSAIEDGYKVDINNDSVNLSNKLYNTLLSIISDEMSNVGMLDQKQMDLFLSIIIQAYDSGNIKTDKIEEIDNYIDQIFTGDDDAYRLKCWIFLSDPRNLQNYDLPKDFGFDYQVEDENGNKTQKFGYYNTKQMKAYLGSKGDKVDKVHLIDFLAEQFEDQDTDQDLQISSPIKKTDKYSKDVFKAMVYIGKILQTPSVRDSYKSILQYIKDKSDSFDERALGWYNDIINLLNKKVPSDSEVDPVIKEMEKKLDDIINPEESSNEDNS